MWLIVLVVSVFVYLLLTLVCFLVSRGDTHTDHKKVKDDPYNYVIDSF
jgi:hypothetical protein